MAGSTCLDYWLNGIESTVSALAGRCFCVCGVLKQGKTLLQLRHSCEHCNKALPPASLEARICSYECTFCASCVDEALEDVCPNCCDGFVSRPIRLARN